MSKRVYVVGLDGVPPSIANRGIDDGQLPALANIRDAGCSGITRSTCPPLSMLAWSTFSTGRTPGNHGIYNFIQKDPDGTGTRFASYSELRENSIPYWEYLDAQGRSSGVVNLMPSYPPANFNGYQISDHITTPPEGSFAFPPELQERFEDATGEFEHAPITGYQPGDPERLAQFVQRFIDIERTRTSIFKEIIQEFPTAVTNIVFSGPDVFLHEVGHLSEPSHPKYSAEEAAIYDEAVYDLLGVYDDFLTWLNEWRTENDVLMVLSDHGHTPVYRSVNLNSWLHQHGYLALEDSVTTQAKKLVYNHLFDSGENILKLTGLYDRVKLWLAQKDSGGAGVLSSLTFSQADIDWAGTDAYTIAGDGQIFINAKRSSEQYDRIESRLRQDLEKMRDPESDDLIVDEIIDSDDIYDGQYTSNRPDLVCVPNQGYRFTFPQTMQTNQYLVDPQKWSSHTSRAEMSGIFFADGHGIAQRDDIEIPLVNFAPTILHMLGVSVPTAMDGHVHGDLFEGALDIAQSSYDGRVEAKRTVRAIANRASAD